MFCVHIRSGFLVMIKPVFKSLAIVFSSAALLASGVAYGATSVQSFPESEGSSLVAQATCDTDVDVLPTANADVDYVTVDTACFDEKDGVTVNDEAFAIEYDPAVGYYYINYDGDRWYFIEWDGVVLLTDGENYVEFALAS
jgi:hypothetical protein